MSLRNIHFSAGRGDSYHSFQADASARFFFWPFRKKKGKFIIRGGALQPDEVKKRIQEAGIGKQVEIIRIGYDGMLDDMPVVVEIIDISNHGFTGRIVNLERLMIESATRNLIYAKKGGGVLEFFYNDGDIKDITLSRDKELLEKERNISSLTEILAALDQGDHVIVAYFDTKHKATVNTEGMILEKDETNENFTLQIEKINRIELEKKISKQFNIQKDLVIDIEMV
jgi:hypothetical protein